MLYRSITAEIITEYLFAQSFGFLDDEEKAMGMFDKSTELLLGIAHLGRFIDRRIPQTLDLVIRKVKNLLGVKQPKYSIMDFFMACLFHCKVVLG